MITMTRSKKRRKEISTSQPGNCGSLPASAGAIEGAHGTLEAVLAKARFLERFAKEPLTQRQIKVLNRMMDGFEGKLTTSKWARLAKCSQDSAYRDILDLIERGALEKDPGGGRSTSYFIRFPG